MGRDQRSRSSSSDDHGSEKDQISINQQENVLKEEEARHQESRSSLNASFKAAKESQESDMERCKQEREMLMKRLEDVECSENNEKERLQDRHEESKHGISSSSDGHDSDKKMSSKGINTGDQGSSTQEANVIKEDRKARLHQELVILGGLNASDKSAKELQELVERCKQDGELLKKLLEDDTEKYTQDEKNSLQETYEECKLYEEGLKHVASIFAEENKLMMHDGEDAKLDEPHVILMLHRKPWKQKLQIVCYSFKKMMDKIDRMVSLKESTPTPNQQNIQDKGNTPSDDSNDLFTDSL